MTDLPGMITGLVSPDNGTRNRSKFFFLSLGYDTMCDTLPDRPYERLAEAEAALEGGVQKAIALVGARRA